MKTLGAKIGLRLIVLMLAMRLSVGQWKLPRGNVDFPCSWYDPAPALAKTTADTRIAYFIDRSRRQYVGIGVYDTGSSREDQLLYV